jgi:hypothetical protein
MKPRHPDDLPEEFFLPSPAVEEKEDTKIPLDNSEQLMLELVYHEN